MGRSGIFAAWVTIGVMCGMAWAQDAAGRPAGAGGAAAGKAPASAKATGPASANISAQTQAIASSTGPADASPAILLEKGIYTEETVGDLDAAIKVYQQVIDQAKTSRKYAAQAQYRLAMCYVKKGDKPAAAEQLRQLVASYPQEKDTLGLAQEQMTKLGISSPGRWRHFVLLVVRVGDINDPSTLTFNGEPIVWQDFQEALKRVPNRSNTVLEFAVSSEEFPETGKKELVRNLSRMVRYLGFEYLSDTGIKPLGSKPDADQWIEPESAAPHIVKTNPVAFANDIDPSLERITVTFDQKMTNGNWSWVQRYKDKFPQRNGEISFDADLTTCTMPVKLEAGKIYWIEFNSPPYDSFMSADGKKAKRHALIFATKSADGKPTPLPEDLVQQAKAINAAAMQETSLQQPAAAGALTHVINTSPATLANNIDPSVDKITVTFDRAMKDGSWSFTGGGETFPKGAGAISYDATKTTCAMPVKLEPGKVYWVGVNSPSHKNFKSADGVPAQRYVILFATKSADGKPTPLPEDLVQQAKAINAASQPSALAIATVAVELKDNCMLDLDSGKVLESSNTWPGEYEVSWDNDVGGVLMIYPGSPKTKARFMAIPEAHDLQDAVLKAAEPDMQRLLALSQERGVPATRSRFAAVLTDQQQLAVIEVSKFSPKEAMLQYVVGKPGDLLEKAGAATAVGGQPQAALKGKLINWVEDYFSKNYRDITARKTLAWGQPSQEAGGNVSITYKYAATIWNKDKLIIEQKFTFTPEGKFISAETVEKGPAGESDSSSQPASQPSAADKKEAENLAAEGWRLWNERKLPEAEAKFQAAVAKAPTAANAWNGLGWSQLNQGKKLNAKDAFGKAVAIEPKHPAALNGLGHIAKGEGKIDQAIEYWQKAVAAAPTATAALAGLANAYMEMGQYDKAIEAYQQWLKAEPDNTEAKAGLKKAQEAGEAVKAAVPAAEEWLKLVDSGKYGESWDAGSASMKAAVTRQQWMDTVKPVRPPLGKVGSRKLQSSEFATSFPGMPDGQYVTLKYDSSFENKKEATETVILEKDKDAKFRVAGYFIK